MSVVWIANHDPAVDYSPLEKFGGLAYLTTGSIHPNGHDVVEANIIKRLIFSKPGDHLAISGHSLESSLAVAVWNTIHKTLRMLIQDKDLVWHLVLLPAGDLNIRIEEARDTYNAKATIT